jgi:hypothetical protein
MAALLIINFIFIIDIELALKKNQNLVGNDESQWTFGQILSLLLLVLPLRDLVEMVLARREKRLRKRETEKEKQRKEEHTISLRHAINSGKLEGILPLVENGADINTRAQGIVTTP